MYNYKKPTLLRRAFSITNRTVWTLVIMAVAFYLGYSQALKDEESSPPKVNIETHCEQLAEYEFNGVFTETEDCKQQLSVAGF